MIIRVINTVFLIQPLQHLNYKRLTACTAGKISNKDDTITPLQNIFVNPHQMLVTTHPITHGPIDVHKLIYV